ncbi:hypothetical protein [Leptospira stimsonii]|uniref:Lipoprotein n=1 Tax=Leptospira stimsonii TaxID=2202203 RepID=A0ABY2N0W5_9LEPT|nr:hypothetical protein [Leptospira stimsonii]TGK19699.1 hypothetical protein EHO98_10435 [Leptospira stimsonii]TGM13698.1 hypothetical protein EHQ90_12830 [Leptospira stimsonii]
MQYILSSKLRIFFLFLFLIQCGTENQKKENDSALLALGPAFSSSNPNQNDSVIPQEVQSISPAHRGKFRSAYTEEGIHFQSNSCQSNGTFQLERISVSDPIEINIVYKEAISSGTISLQNSSQVPVPGTITYPDSKSIRFISTSKGELYSKYKVIVQNVTKSSNGASIQDATWTFQYDLDGDRGNTPNQITVDCQENGGVNQCAYVSKFGIGVVSSLTSPQAIFAQTTNNYESYFGLQSSDANGITLWLYEVCKIEDGTANITPLATGKFLFAKMTGIGAFSIPRALIEQNELYTGSVYQYYKNSNGIEFGQPLYPENIQLITNQH